MPQHINKPALCYVIMNFSPELRRTYDTAIKPAVTDLVTRYGAEIRCLRADEIAGPGSIKREIIASIYKANVVIADLTGNNPNVFYELGVSHSVGNKTIMISQSIAEVPFDISAYRLIPYESSASGFTKLRDQLSNAIAEVLAGQCGPNNPVQDFAPIRYTNAVISLADLMTFEGQATSKVWLIEPTLETDIILFRNVLKNNIENRSVQYRYLVPNTKELLRSAQRLREALDVDNAAWQRITIRTVDPHVVESEVVIYDAFTEGERVLLMSPVEDDQPFWFRVRGERARYIRERYESLWHEVSKPLANLIT
jgi:hypothetical protein